PLRVDHKRLNDNFIKLSKINSAEFGSLSRVAYTDADIDGRKYVMQLMRAAGMDVYIDEGGNIIGRLKGKDNDLPPIAIGSHIDSVPEGGSYDGNVGSLAAIEVAHTISENDLALNHPLIVVIFQNEEGGLFGSKVMTTGLTDQELGLMSSSGYTIKEGIKKIGGNLKKLEDAKLKKNEWAAYVELHIEQGAFLYDENLEIGIVEGIVGIKQWEVIVDGFANHAGTTPMDKRNDALYAASLYVQSVHEIGKKTPGNQVATVGMIKPFPGAPNVIPGKVSASLEIRDLNEKKIDSIYKKIKRSAEKIAKRTGTTFQFQQTINIVPEPTNDVIIKAIFEASNDLKLKSKFMPSGAGHDAQEIAQICPIGMIFIPSKNGISHSPKEYSTANDISNGANVLLHTVLKIDDRP
ncbi:MAG: M20 family metallo-hydrolase, partial [Candidatus Marinimicrobia bacterium]|nr:M20 family metallo-hydrolase [Candidatus Neomarinimicrobiota bacterium]